MDSILLALADTPVTGLSGDGPWAKFKGGFILSKDGRDENAVLSIPNATSVRSFCGGRSSLEERSSYKVNFVGKRKVGLSPGLELSMTYQFNVLAIIVMCAGPALLQYEKLLIRVIGAAFDAPSSKDSTFPVWIMRATA